MTQLTAREADILDTLASDAQALKVENGWYGDPKQGDSTRQEDESAMYKLRCLKRELHVQETKALERELVNTGEEYVLLMRENMQREGKLTLVLSKMAADFFGFCRDGDIVEVRMGYEKLKEYVEERRA